MGGVLAATLPGAPVHCAPNEAAYFNPPSGQTCLEFAGEFARQAGQGYLTNPNGTSNCGYCPYASGDEYLVTLSVSPGQKWRDFGVFLAFCVSNWAYVFFPLHVPSKLCFVDLANKRIINRLVYFFIYTVRVKGWTFGFGPIFSGLGKGVDKIKGSIAGALQRKNRAEKGKGKDSQSSSGSATSASAV